MPDLIVVVPGIMGSVLTYRGAEVWNTSLRTVVHDLKRFDELTRILRLPTGIGDGEPEGESALEADRLIGGWHLWPGIWSGAGYHDFVEHLGKRYRANRRVVQFAYDWRLSIRLNAERLGRFIERELAAWRERSGAAEARAALICHSMGGLIARFYVNKLTGSASVSRIVTLGTPFAGSVKALRYLVGGDALIPDTLTDTLRTFPSLWQLLPTYRCMRTEHGMAPIGPSSVPGIESWMIQDALLLREQSAPHRDSPPIHVFGGHRQGTLTSVQVAPEALIFHETWLDSANGQTAEYDYRGDGTVPRFAAVPTEWDDDSAAIFRAERHGELPDHPHIRELACDKLEGLRPREFLSEALELGLDLPDLAPADKPVQVRAVTNGAEVRLEATVTDLRGDSQGPPTPLRLSDDNSYHAELQLPRGSWHVAVSAPDRTPPVRVGDVVVVC